MQAPASPSKTTFQVLPTETHLCNWELVGWYVVPNEMVFTSGAGVPVLLGEDSRARAAVIIKERKC